MSTKLPQVYLVRHGETAWSLSGQHTGRTDLPLTERGQRESLWNAASIDLPEPAQDRSSAGVRTETPEAIARWENEGGEVPPSGRR